MIQFFSINDITRYIVLFLFLAIARSLLWFAFPDALLIELHYQNIAEQLDRLGESYIDVLHHLGPLSAVIFRFVYGSAGESLFFARLLAFLLCAVQVLVVSFGLNQVNGLREHSSFFGVIHIVLLHLFPDMLVLSPILIGMTLLSIAYVLILNVIRDKNEDSIYLNIGLLHGIVVGFMFPLVLFSITSFFIIVLYTRVNLRYIGLFLLGLSLPIIMVFSYYFFKNYGSEYISINLYYGFSIRFISQIPVHNYFIIGFIPFVLFLVAFMKILAMYNMVNYQQKMIVSGFFYIITGMLTLLILPDKSIYYFLLLIPFMIHFLGILFIETRFKKINQIVFMCFTIMLALPFVSKIKKVEKYLDSSSLIPSEIIPNYGRVLNLSDDKNVLANNKYATGFCEYMVAETFFIDKAPEATILVFNKIEADLPDAIYDPNGIVKEKFKLLPDLQRKYRFHSHISTYRLIP